MRRLFLTIALTLSVLAMTAAPADAQAIRIRGVSFALGSLIAEGEIQFVHYHPENVEVELYAKGNAKVTCTDGHRSYEIRRLVKVEAIGYDTLYAGDFYGKVAHFSTETETPTLLESVHCRYGWAEIGFVYWTHAEIHAHAPVSQLSATQTYKCKTTPDCVICKRTSNAN